MNEIIKPQKYNQNLDKEYMERLSSNL